MNLIDLATLGPGLQLGTDERLDPIPSDVIDAALDALRGATSCAEPGVVDTEVVIARTFDRKGVVSVGDPCGDRNASYSRGDADGYLVAFAVHFPASHPPLRDEQGTLDAALGRTRREYAEAHVAALTARIDELDATRATLIEKLEDARASLGSE